MRIPDAGLLSGFARTAAESVSDFAGVFHNLILDVRDSYRPELHYMRGPGPKWRARHQAWFGQGLDSEAVAPGGQGELFPVLLRRSDAVNPVR